MPIYNGVTKILFGEGILIEPGVNAGLGQKVMVTPFGPQSNMVVVTKEGTTLTICKQTHFIQGDRGVRLEGNANIGRITLGDHNGDLSIDSLDFSDTANKQPTYTYIKVRVVSGNGVGYESI